MILPNSIVYATVSFRGSPTGCLIADPDKPGKYAVSGDDETFLARNLSKTYASWLASRSQNLTVHGRNEFGL